MAAFTGLTGDVNPIHHQKGSPSPPLPPPLVPGLLTASLFPALVGTAWPGALYARQALRFLGPLRVGEGVRASVVVERVRRRREGGEGGSNAGSAVVTFRTTAVRMGGDRGCEAVVVEGEATAVVPVAGRV